MTMTPPPVGKVYVSGAELSDIRILDSETLDEVGRIPTETNDNRRLVVSDYLEEEEMNLVAFSEADSSTYQSHVFIHNSLTNERLSQIVNVPGLRGLEILSSSSPIVVSAQKNRLCAYDSLTTQKLIDCQNLPFYLIKRIKCFPEWNTNEVFVGGEKGRNGLLHRYDLNQDCVMLGSYVGHVGSRYSSSVWGIAASLPDGILISGSNDGYPKGTLKLWSKDTFECIKSVTLDHSCSSLGYSPDSHLICCGTYKEIEIFDIRNMRNRIRKVLNVGNGCVFDLDSISNSPLFVSGDQFGLVSIWNPLTGKVLRKARVGGGIGGIRFLPSLIAQQGRVFESEREEDQRTVEMDEVLTESDRTEMEDISEDLADPLPLQIFLNRLDLDDYLHHFKEEAIKLEDLPSLLVEDDLLENWIPLDCPRLRFVRHVGALSSRLGQSAFTLDRCIELLDRLEVANHGSEELSELLQSLDGFPSDVIRAFSDEKVIYSDLCFILDLDLSALLRRLIPKFGHRQQFVRLVRSLNLTGPMEALFDSKLQGWIQECEVVPHEASRRRWNSVTHVGGMFDQGSFGVLKRGRYGGMPVVVKDILLKSKAHYEMAVEEFQHLLDFQHRLVVRVFGFSIKDGETPVFRIIMESMAMNLREFIKQHDLTLFQKFLVLWECSKVLHFLHEERRTMHRDVKAENFLVGGDLSSDRFSPIIKIADFGLATRKQSLATVSIHTSRRGTLFWMSPESFSDHYGFSSDIYSLACTFYEVLYKCFPFRSRHDPLKDQVNDINICNAVSEPNSARPCLLKLQDYCPEFADLVGRMWSRPVGPLFDSMVKVVEWFEENEELMREKYENERFDDGCGPRSTDDQIVRSPIDDVFQSEDF